MASDKNMTYHSSERRNAVRVTPNDHKLSFDQGSFKLNCLDISMDGVALKSDKTLPTLEGEQVAFVLDQNDVIIGKVRARLVYKQDARSGWQFTALEDAVRSFIDQLVLDTQKDALRKAAGERLAEKEKQLLDLDSQSNREDFD